MEDGHRTYACSNVKRYLLMRENAMDKVYLLTNQAMPNLVKIGHTRNKEVEDRMKEIDKTGVPLPFECYYAAEVEDGPTVEKALHSAFTESRVRGNREFFEIDPNRAKVILELLAVKEVTPHEQVVSSPEDTEALVKSAAKVGRFRFSTAGIPIGTTLTFSRDETKTATVSSDNDIDFNGAKTSVSRSALEIMHSLGYNWKTCDGTAFWLYDGQTLKERRREREELEQGTEE